MSTPVTYGPQHLTLESVHGAMTSSEERFAFLAEAASYTKGVEQIVNPDGTSGILRTCAVYSIAHALDLSPAALAEGMELEMLRMEAFGVKVPPHATYVCRSAVNGRAYSLTDVAFIAEATTPTAMDGEQREHYGAAIDFTYEAMRAYFGCSTSPAQLVMRDLNSPRQFAGTPADTQQLWCLDIGPPVARRSSAEVALQLRTQATTWRRFSQLALADYNLQNAV